MSIDKKPIKPRLAILHAQDIAVQKLLEKADRLIEGGLYEQAIEVALKAWRIIPRTRAQTDLSGRVSASLFHSCVKLMKYDAAENWLATAWRYEATDIDATEVMLTGIALFERQDFIGAAYCFRYLFFHDKHEFERHPLRYLEFYLSTTESDG